MNYWRRAGSNVSDRGKCCAAGVSIALSKVEVLKFSSSLFLRALRSLQRLKVYTQNMHTCVDRIVVFPSHAFFVVPVRGVFLNFSLRVSLSGVRHRKLSRLRVLLFLSNSSCSKIPATTPPSSLLSGGQTVQARVPRIEDDKRHTHSFCWDGCVMR